jgi:hypothetical protein
MGAVDTTYTFTATDTITSTKMNNIIDQTTITTDAIIGTTLEVASGKLKIRSAGITSNELASNAVTTTKITDLNVTTGKIADLAVATGKIANLGVTTAKIADSNVTTVKIANANVTPAKLSQPFTLGTAQATTSGTSIDFTGIPSWVKRITLMLNEVSTNGTSPVILQLGDSGGVEITGYLGSATEVKGTPDSDLFTTGFGVLQTPSANDLSYGIATIVNLSSNIWVYSFTGGCSNAAQTYIGGGSKTLSATLDRLRLTTVGGVNAFDAGSVNIMYE